MEDSKSQVKRIKRERQYVTVGQAAIETGLDSQTVRKLVDNGTLVSYRTPAQQRRIHLESLYAFVSRSGCSNPESQALVSCLARKKPFETVQNFLYARVPSRAYSDEMKKQLEYIQRPEYAGYTILTDYAPGTDFTRKGLTMIIDACLSKCIGDIIIASRDVFCRFMFGLIEQLVQRAGGRIIVMDDVHETTKSITRENGNMPPESRDEIQGISCDQDIYNDFLYFAKQVFGVGNSKKRNRFRKSRDILSIEPAFKTKETVTALTESS